MRCRSAPSVSHVYEVPHSSAADNVEFSFELVCTVEPMASFSSYSLVCFLGQGEVVFSLSFCFFVFSYSNWSPQQLHAHRSDQFTFPLAAAESRAVYVVWVVWTGHQVPRPPEAPRMHYTAPSGCTELHRATVGARSRCMCVVARLFTEKIRVNPLNNSHSDTYVEICSFASYQQWEKCRAGK